MLVFCVCCIAFVVVFCVLRLARCAYCPVVAVGCSLRAVRCLLLVVCSLMFKICCLMFVLFVFGGCLLFVRC